MSLRDLSLIRIFNEKNSNFQEFSKLNENVYNYAYNITPEHPHAMECFIQVFFEMQTETNKRLLMHKAAAELV